MPDRHPFIKASLLPPVDGLRLPVVGPHQYPLVDDDEKVCRVISDDELDERYLDDNIDTYQLHDVNWLTLAVDKELVDLVYFDRRKASVRLGAISLDAGRRAKQYAMKKGVIYPINNQGDLVLNATSTPNLAAAIRRWYLAEVKRIVDRRVEIAEVVHAFATCVGHLGNAGR